MVGMDGSLQHRATLIRIRKGILEDLFDSGQNSFYWAITEDGGKSSSAWNRFYPDAFAQIFPVYYGILDDQITVRNSLWGEFARRYEGSISGFPIEQRLLYGLAKKKMERAEVR